MKPNFLPINGKFKNLDILIILDSYETEQEDFSVLYIC